MQRKSKGYTIKLDNPPIEVQEKSPIKPKRKKQEPLAIAFFKWVRRNAPAWYDETKGEQKYERRGKIYTIKELYEYWIENERSIS